MGEVEKPPYCECDEGAAFTQTGEAIKARLVGVVL